jgi:hypothetical protein
MVGRPVEAMVGRMVEAMVGRTVEAMVGRTVEAMVGRMVEGPGPGLGLARDKEYSNHQLAIRRGVRER